MRRVRVKELQGVIRDDVYTALVQVLGDDTEVLFERRGQRYLIVL